MWLLSKNQFVRALPLLLAGVECRKEKQVSERNAVGKMPLDLERRKGIERFAADDIDHFCNSIESCKEFNEPNTPNRKKVSYQRVSVSHLHFHQVRWARVQ